MALDAAPRIYVEGKDDVHVIVQLLMRHGIFAHAQHGNNNKLPRDVADRVQVVVQWLDGDGVSESESQTESSSGGKEKFLQAIGQVIRLPKANGIGIVLDADDPNLTPWSRQKTWARIRRICAVEPVSIVAPDEIEPDGFIGRHQGTKTPIGVWLMPDNQSDGSIEDFLKGLIEGGDVLVPIAELSTSQAFQVGQRFTPAHLRKAELHAWLAWQEQPGSPYGLAIKSRCFRHDTPIALRFVEWVKNLLQQAELTPA